MPFPLMGPPVLIPRQLDGGNAHETARSRHQTLSCSSRSCFTRSGNIGRADSFQCEPECDAFVYDPPQFLGQCDARVFRGEGWQLGESFGNLAGTRKQLVGGDDLVDGTPLLAVSASSSWRVRMK